LVIEESKPLGKLLLDDIPLGNEFDFAIVVVVSLDKNELDSEAELLMILLLDDNDVLSK